jgi:hypothetical protein
LECGENNWAPHRWRIFRTLGATALNPVFIFSARGTCLEGGNHGVQKCDSVDPLSLVIQCLGGRPGAGGLDSPDVWQTALFLWRPSQHRHHHMPTHPTLVVPPTPINMTNTDDDDNIPDDESLDAEAGKMEEAVLGSKTIDGRRHFVCNRTPTHCTKVSFDNKSYSDGQYKNGTLHITVD